MIKDRRITVPIHSINEETDDVRTFYFRAGLDAAPGQFIMITDFRGGEKPFSISDCGSRNGRSFLAVTVKRVGELTSRLFDMKRGDFLSIRGAFGSSFFIPGGQWPAASGLKGPGPKPREFRPVLCGGGFGLPPLYFLASELIKAGVSADEISVISAARTESELLFEERFQELGVVYTGAAEKLDYSPAEDGCGRICGTAADALAETAVGDDFNEPGCNFVYASGSDLMMKSLIPHIPVGCEYQFLFERYMKCAVGICGSCVVDPSGLRICKEGPALWRAQIEGLEDFGVYRRTASGNIEYFTDRMSAVVNMEGLQ